MESFFEEQSIREVDQWLDLVNFETNNGAALAEDNSFLWLHGIPDAGKTVLVSNAIKFLKEHVKSQDIDLAYSYCNHKELKKQEPSSLRCTLLAQLARQHKAVFQRLQAFALERVKEYPASVPTHDELRECISIDLEEDNESMDSDSVETYPKNLLTRCSSLVTVSDHGRVSLAHFTVKKFLVLETTRNDLNAFYVRGKEVEVDLAQTCLTYLCYDDSIAGSIADEEALEETMTKYRFLEYASTAWELHAHLSKGKEDALLDLTKNLLKSLSEGRGNYEFWLQVYQASKEIHHSHLSECKPLFFAASFGLHDIFKALVQDEEENDLSRGGSSRHTSCPESR
ncbi:MAG: hypothetical protein Q9209_004753 [Squamulea sp. 1 TL-2023]